MQAKSVPTRTAETRRIPLTSTFALALVSLQFAAIRFATDGWMVRISLPATIVAAPLVLWPYRHRLGTWVILVGLAANLAVILANGGLMPIERRTVERAIGVEDASRYVANQWIPGSKDVLVEDGRGRAAVLGDSIIVRLGSGGFAASPGDIVIWFGAALLGAEAAVAWRRGKRVSSGIAPHVAVGELHPHRAEGGAPSLS